MDPFNLQRFVEAQSAVYDQVLKELREGEKRTHWMWFVFPQVENLGYSPMARKYAIGSKAEVRAYLEHEILGERLRECVDVLLGLEDRSASQIFGQVDAMKLRSSLTLFSTAADKYEALFKEALNKYFNGQKDSATVVKLALLQDN